MTPDTLRVTVEVVSRTAEYWEGYEAGANPKASMSNPYNHGTDESRDWYAGWEDGDRDARNKVGE